jgi:hypothetical protein
MPQLLTSVSRAAHFKAALLIITNSAIKGKIFLKNIFDRVFREIPQVDDIDRWGRGQPGVRTLDKLFQQAAAFSKIYKKFLLIT